MTTPVEEDDDISSERYSRRITTLALRQREAVRRARESDATPLHATVSFVRGERSLQFELLDKPIAYGRFGAIWDVRRRETREGAAAAVESTTFDWCVKELLNPPQGLRAIPVRELHQNVREEYENQAVAYVMQTDALSAMRKRRSSTSNGVKVSDLPFVACPTARHENYLFMERLYGEVYKKTLEEIDRYHRDEEPDFRHTLKRGLARQYDRKFRALFTLCNMFHWDLHAGNVFLSKGNRLYILDFGRIERDVDPEIVAHVKADPQLFIPDIKNTEGRLEAIKRRIATSRVLAPVVVPSGNAVVRQRVVRSTTPPPPPTAKSDSNEDKSTTTTTKTALVVTGFGVLMLTGIGFSMYQNMTASRPSI